jgi:hypothetical protein
LRIAAVPIVCRGSGQRDGLVDFEVADAERDFG